MKDFVEIQYFILWKLYFDQNYLWLVETIIGIRGKHSSKKELIFCLVETVFHAISLLVETIIGIRRKQFWKKDLILASGKLVFRLVETIFFYIFW